MQVDDRHPGEVRPGNDQGLVGEAKLLDVAKAIDAVELRSASMGDRDVAVTVNVAGTGRLHAIGVRVRPSMSYAAKLPLKAAVSMFIKSPVTLVVSDLISRTITSWPGLKVPLNISAVSSLMLSAVVDFRAGAVAVGADADADVEPLVAVDDVIAAAARDLVIAVAAKDDVAGIEEGDAVTDHRLEPVDQRDTLRIEEAAKEGMVGAARESVGRGEVAARQAVVKARSGQALDAFEPLQRNVGRIGRGLVEDEVVEQAGVDSDGDHSCTSPSRTRTCRHAWRCRGCRP